MAEFAGAEREEAGTGTPIEDAPRSVVIAGEQRARHVEPGGRLAFGEQSMTGVGVVARGRAVPARRDPR